MNQREKVDDEVTLSKFEIDENSDFMLRVAHETYSKIWDQNPPQKVKTEINKIFSLLSEKKLDYKTFYSNINEFRKEFIKNDYHGRRRNPIQTQRKRDWRKKEARKRKNGRYKK